jgi:PKD repeat protein
MNDKRCTITVAVALLVVAGALAGCVEEGDDDDFGMTWYEPNEVDYELTVDNENAGFSLRIRLFDDDNEVTEWNGLFEIRIWSDNLDLVFNSSLEVRASDFTTVKEGNVVDTYYDMTIDWDDMVYVNANMRTDPDLYMSVQVKFTANGKTYEVGWTYEAPDEVFVYAEWDDDNETVLLDVVLEDVDDFVTKWSGTFRYIIWDSNDFEMYNKTLEVSADQFTVEGTEDGIDTWFETAVDVADILKTNDRLERTMRVFAWFVSDGMTLMQDPYDSWTELFAIEIPDGLLLPNEAPDATFTVDGDWFEGTELTFDASGSTDDLGTEGLSYMWDWDDGSDVETTDEPTTTHTFDGAGTYDVLLTVTDLEDATGTMSVAVEVAYTIDLIVTDVGQVTTPGERFNNSFVTVRFENAAPFTVTVPSPNPVVYDAFEELATLNHTVGSVLTQFDVDGSMTLTFYFAMLPPGGGDPIAFDAVKMEIWGRVITL